MNRLHLLLLKRKNLGLVFLAVLLAEGTFFYFYYRDLYRINCESSFTFRAPQHDFALQGTMTFRLDHDGLGEIGIDGVVNSKGEQSRLIRYVQFIYRPVDRTSFKMDNMKMIKGTRDNAPDKSIDDNFFSLALEARRVLTLHRVENGYLVGNLQAPAFMCLPH